MTNPISHNDWPRSYWEGKKLHRVGGPAVIRSDGSQVYYEYDKIHRIGGPAYIGIDGIIEYYINGKQVTKLEHDLLCDFLKLKHIL
jgi:hypothetical protein